jgi:hypothetical protein
MKLKRVTLGQCQESYDNECEPDRPCDTCIKTCCKDCLEMPFQSKYCNCPECENYSDNIDPGYDGILGEG